MKTIREHLESLPEPYRTQALENMRPEKALVFPSMNCRGEALTLAFDWERSPEGYLYWEERYEHELEISQK